MTYSVTLNYGFKKPTLFNDWGQWGYRLNENWDQVDALLNDNFRRTLDVHIPTFTTEYNVFGEYKQLASGVTIDATPTSIYIGGAKVIIEVTAGTGTITLSGTKMSQNTLTEVADTEEIQVDENAKYISQEYWTGQLDITCDATLTADIYVYSGFSLDKNFKIAKITIKGVCNNDNNDLDAELIIFDILGKKVTTEVFDKLSINKTYAPGPYVHYYWHRELSVLRDIIRNNREFIFSLKTANSGSWNNLLLTLYLE